jgi:hypothetical protein
MNRRAPVRAQAALVAALALALALAGCGQVAGPPPGFAACAPAGADGGAPP